MYILKQQIYMEYIEYIETVIDDHRGDERVSHSWWS